MAKLNIPLRTILIFRFFIVLSLIFTFYLIHATTPSEEAIKEWEYRGERKSGGKVKYSDHVIELFLLMKEFYKLAYRQTEGFVGSILEKLEIKLEVPDYTTLSRRAGKLKLIIRKEDLIRSRNEDIIVAIDSTGLSLYGGTKRNSVKHDGKRLKRNERWRKLHVAIDVESGEIIGESYTESTVNDCEEVAPLLEVIEENIGAVCGDMAYYMIR